MPLACWLRWVSTDSAEPRAREAMSGTARSSSLREQAVPARPTPLPFVLLVLTAALAAPSAGPGCWSAKGDIGCPRRRAAPCPPAVPVRPGPGNCSSPPGRCISGAAAAQPRAGPLRRLRAPGLRAAPCCPPCRALGRRPGPTAVPGRRTPDPAVRSGLRSPRAAPRALVSVPPPRLRLGRGGRCAPRCVAPHAPAARPARAGRAGLGPLVVGAVGGPHPPPASTVPW